MRRAVRVIPVPDRRDSPVPGTMPHGQRAHCTVEWREDRYVKFVITISQDEDGAFIAECPAIPGCVSQGKTEEEAQANVQAAIKECLEVRAEQGLPLTVATRQVEVHV